MVDFFFVGCFSVYLFRMCFWLWVLIWFVCNVFVLVVVLLVWLKGEFVSGFRFWVLIIGVLNGLFLVLFGFGCVGYEGLWYCVYWCNYYCDCWFVKKIGFV